MHQTFNDMAKNINRKVTIYINGKEVENTLKGMKAEMSRLVNEQRQATFGSKEYIEATTKIETLKKYIEVTYTEFTNSSVS